jgi:hypothetical protein
MRRSILVWLVVLGGLAGCGAPQTAAPAPRPKSVIPERYTPVVRGTDDVTVGPVRTEAAKSPQAAATVKSVPPVQVDEKARTVRIPCRFSGARGVVEWLVSAGGKHPATSVLLTDAAVRDIAAAMAKAGLTPGVRPEAVGEDRARAPKGAAVSIEVVIKGGGQDGRAPATTYFSRESGGKPMNEGTWIYVGPQSFKEGDAEILVTDLSGSIATTNLRDSSALIYWAPKATGDAPAYVTAFYASNVPQPAEGTACELEIKPAQ